MTNGEHHPPQFALDVPVLSSMSEVDVVANDLASAFASYPLSLWLFRRSGNLDKERCRFFRFLLEEFGYKYGKVYRPQAGGAAAVWIDSDRLPNLTVTRKASLLISLSAIVGIAGTPRFVETYKAMKRYSPSEPHIYFYLLGVHPRLQHSGVGLRLIIDGLKKADARRCSTFLETSSEANVGYYKRFGFEVRDVYDITAGSPPTWTMWRPAGANAMHL